MFVTIIQKILYVSTLLQNYLYVRDDDETQTKN